MHSRLFSTNVRSNRLGQWPQTYNILCPLLRKNPSTAQRSMQPFLGRLLCLTAAPFMYARGVRTLPIPRKWHFELVLFYATQFVLRILFGSFVRAHSVSFSRSVFSIRQLWTRITWPHGRCTLHTPDAYSGRVRWRQKCRFERDSCYLDAVAR